MCICSLYSLLLLLLHLPLSIDIIITTPTILPPEIDYRRELTRPIHPLHHYFGHESTTIATTTTTTTTNAHCDHHSTSSSCHLRVTISAPASQVPRIRIRFSWLVRGASTLLTSSIALAALCAPNILRWTSRDTALAEQRKFPGPSLVSSSVRSQQIVLLPRIHPLWSFHFMPRRLQQDIVLVTIGEVKSSWERFE